MGSDEDIRILTISRLEVAIIKRAIAFVSQNLSITSQAITVRRNPHLESAQPKKDKLLDTHFPLVHEPQI